MKKHFFLLLFLTLTFSKPVLSAENDSLATRVFVLIYNEKYTEAHHEILANEAILGNFYSDVLTIDLLWWEFVQSKKSKAAFISFLDRFDNRYQNHSELKLRELIKNSYLIRFDLKRFNIIGAMNARTTIKNLLDEIASEKLDFPENHLKLLKLYSSLFQYFNNLINPFYIQLHRDDRFIALKQIEEFTIDNDIIVKTLSLYFVGKIYLNIEKEKNKGKYYFTELSNIYRKNTVFKKIIQTNQ